MVDTVQILLAFPPDKKKLSAKEYESQIIAHIKEISRISPSALTKTYDKKSLLELLDPSVNSISYLFVLQRLLDVSQNDSSRLDQVYQHVLEFLAVFDPLQIRYAGEYWRFVFEKAIIACTNVQSKAALPSVTPFVDGLLRLDPTAGTFTSNHLFIVQACLSLGVPSQALPILDKDIYAFSQKQNKNVPDELLSEEHEMSNTYINTESGFSQDLKSSHVLQYYLLGGQIYVGLRNFRRARLFFEYVLLSPTQQHITSALQAEAYKKWTLVGLLAEGKRWPVPRTMDQVVLKTIRAVSKPYDSIAESFEKRDVKKFQAELEIAGTKEWQEDGNFRLLNEVHRALDRYRVIDLQKTYATLPLARVATLLDMQPQQTVQLLQDTIRGGYLNASISSADADAVLNFQSSTTSPSSQEQDLEAQTARIQELVTYIRDADRRLQLTKEYIEHQKRAKRAGGPDGDLADAMDLSWDGPVGMSSLHEGSDDEEDIMA